MKYFILVGGFTGFVATLSSGIVAGTEAASALLDASVGCIAGGLMLGAFRACMIRCWRQTMEEKVRQQQAAMNEEAAAV